MSIEETLELIGSEIPNIVISDTNKNPYLGDYSCWTDKTIFFNTTENPFPVKSKDYVLYFFDGWEMNLSDCTKVTLDELGNRYLKLRIKVDRIKKQMINL